MNWIGIWKFWYRNHSRTTRKIIAANLADVDSALSSISSEKVWVLPIICADLEVSGEHVVPKC